MKTVLIACAALAVAVIAFLGIVQSNQDTSQNGIGTLYVGTNAEYPPYTYIQEGEVIGFDIDVATEISQRLGKKMVIHDMPFDALLSELMLKKVDFLAAGMTPTEERAHKVSFTNFYHSDQLVIVSLPGTLLKSIADLKGKKIVVNEGYTADLFASKIGGMDLLRIPSPADALVAINSKRAVAFITASSTVNNFKRKDAHNRYEISPLKQTSEGVSLVVNKDNINLLNDLNRVLIEMEADGTMARLKEKWGLL